MTFARVGRRDHNAHRFLIEALEAAVPLQVLQMTANRAFMHELVELLRCDELRRQQSFRAEPAHRPALA